MTLLEVMLGVGIFAMVATAAYGISNANIRATRTYRERSAVSALADYYIEIARNLPYSQIGTINGNPWAFSPTNRTPSIQRMIVPNIRSTTWSIMWMILRTARPLQGPILHQTTTSR